MTQPTYDLNYTIQSLADQVNSSAEGISSRVKLASKSKDLLQPNDPVPDAIAQNIVNAFEKMVQKQAKPTNVIALPQSAASQEPQAVTEEVSGEIELSRLNLSDIKQVAKQFGITQNLARELEEAAFYRNIELEFLRAQSRQDLVEGIQDAVKASRQLQRIKAEDERLDAEEAAILHLQNNSRIEAIDEKFKLGLQSTIDKLKDAAQIRAEQELKRSQWLADLEAGKELPEEALADPFVQRAFFQRTA